MWRKQLFLGILFSQAALAQSTVPDANSTLVIKMQQKTTRALHVFQDLKYSTFAKNSQNFYSTTVTPKTTLVIASKTR